MSTVRELIKYLENRGKRIRHYCGPVEIIGEPPQSDLVTIPARWYDTTLIAYQIWDVPSAVYLNGTFRLGRVGQDSEFRQRLSTRLWGNASSLGSLLSALGYRDKDVELRWKEAEEIEKLLKLYEPFRALVDWFGRCPSCQIVVRESALEYPRGFLPPPWRAVCPRCEGPAFGCHAIADFGAMKLYRSRPDASQER